MTRSTFIYFTILFAACGQEYNSESNISSVNQNQDSLYSDSSSNIIEHFRTPYLIGDINNDNKEDTAYVIYDRSIRTDGTIEKKCVNKNCEVSIEFSGNIPDLIIDHSLSIYIQKTEDLNNDKANDIMLFSEWVEGWWKTIYVWSYKEGNWTMLASTQAFFAEDQDWENRIVKRNSKYYLIGDDRWNDSTGTRSLQIEIKK